MAEKLSYILEALDKLKTTATSRQAVAVAMIEKVPEEWVNLSTELNRIGDVFDSSIATTLEQVRNSIHTYTYISIQ